MRFHSPPDPPQDTDGSTSLHYAVLSGNPELCEQLCTRDATVTGDRNRFEQTALHVAFEKYKQNANVFLRILTRYGADESAKDQRGLTPAQCANAQTQEEEEAR